MKLGAFVAFQVAFWSVFLKSTPDPQVGGGIGVVKGNKYIHIPLSFATRSIPLPFKFQVLTRSPSTLVYHRHLDVLYV